jgi:predicted MPP superfamily phosphohydrolase
MGLIIQGKRLENIVALTNSLNPDIIVITGDLVDEQALRMENLIEPLQRLKSKYGVFACTGNHEFFAGIDKSTDFIKKAGVTLLRNRWIEVAGGLQLVGRDDPVGARVVHEQIPPLAEIMKGIDPQKPIILLYHTPGTTMDELQRLGINLQLSGHTHQGQLWPFRYIVKMIFAMPYGLFSSGNTTVYVNRGTGTWGPPMRVGAPPEIAFITLYAEDKP